MLVPQRNYQSPAYRYGFQGQEKDDEVKGNGNSLNYTFRMHDPRVGRFFAIDPLTYDFPYNSPYAFSENRVIDAIEFEGLESMPMGYFHGLPSDVADEAARGFIKSTNKGAIATGAVAIVIVDFVFLKGAITKTSGTIFTGLAMGDAYEMMQNTDKIHQAEKAGDFQKAMRLESKNLKLSESVVGEMFGSIVGYSIGRLFKIVKRSNILLKSENIVKYGFETEGEIVELGEAYLNNKTLELDFQIPYDYQGKGIGTEMFDDALKTFGSKIEKVQGLWTDGTNLKLFNEALENGLKADKAAFETVTGKWAKKHGFNKVEIIQNLPLNKAKPNGARGSVKVNFYKE